MNLKEKCVKIRKDILTEIGTLGVGHIGGCMSMVELLVTLYYKHMNIDPKNPSMEGRDRLIVSKGHSGPAVYAVLSDKGYFDKKWLLTLNKPGTNLPSHCDMNRTPGIDMTTGSLGQGFSCAVGIAKASKIRKDGATIYTIIGDGETQEGQIWEAAMFAGAKKLDNLTVIVDNNNLQIDGTIEDVCSPYPIDKKFEAFNFHVINIDAHNFDEIRAALKEARETKGMPTAIIMKSIKGKGVSFMENQASWHGAAPNDEQFEQAMEELEKAGEALCQK